MPAKLPPYTLLLTGFEPFDAHDMNPSWEIARHLGGQELGGVKIVSRLLPVDWERSWPALLGAMNATKPRWVLMLGLAAKREHLSVESVACNVCGDTADNAGALPASGTIAEGGPETLASTLPVEDIVGRVQQLGVPVLLSSDAGGYLCNYTLYRALAWSQDAGSPPLIGFIHVPPLSGATAVPGMLLDDMIHAVREAILAIVESRETSK